jgi:hypothetical protein
MSRRGGTRLDYEERDTYYRDAAPAPPTRTRVYEEEDVYRRGPDRDRQPEFLREDFTRVEQPLVLRGREVETFTRPVPVERPPVERIVRREEIRRERSVSPVRSRYFERSPSPVERERIRTRIVERERSPSPAPVERERIRTRFVERERSPSPVPIERERIRTRIVERDRSPSPVHSGRPRFVERSPSPVERERIRTRIDIRERERSPTPPERIRTRIVERETRTREPSPEPLLPPPIIIREPPIHQEIITHHRHIDHGRKARNDIEQC